MLYRLVLSEIFSCRLDSEGYAFLAKYPEMVKWWMSQKFDAGQAFGAFRSQYYQNWRTVWCNYNSQHAQSSSTFAYTLLKSKEQANVQETVLMGRFAVVSSRIVRLEDEKLVFPTLRLKKAQIRLTPENSFQRVLLEQAQNGYWRLGQVFLTHEFCVVSFTRFIDLAKEKDPVIQTLIK